MSQRDLQGLDLSRITPKTRIRVKMLALQTRNPRRSDFRGALFQNLKMSIQEDSISFCSLFLVL
jgi:hypothetical protein